MNVDRDTASRGPSQARGRARGEAQSGRGARTAQGERSRARILEAATQLISEHGYSGTSVGDVCKQAGVAKTALYWHFDSKEGLMAAVLESVGNSWIEEIRKSVYLEGDPVQRLDRLIADWRRILRDHSQLLRLQLLALLEGNAATEHNRNVLHSIWQRAEEALVQGLEDTVPVPIPDLDLVAHTMLVMMQGVMVSQLLDPNHADADRLFRELRRTVILTVNSRLPDELRYPADNPPF
ncbi:MAG: TetR/AcrR family transcriptional regulator [Myxococcota bacterium]